MKVSNIFKKWSKPYKLSGPGYFTYRYAERERTLDIHFEYLDGSNGQDMVVYASGIKNWMPPYDKEEISESKKREIVERLEKYLKNKKARYRIKW